MSGRKIVDGRPGDTFTIPNDYEGKWSNAIGVPQGTPRGASVPLPPPTTNGNVVTVTRPDFRSIDKNKQVFK